MTPAQLYAALDARRRDLGLLWWQIEVALDTDGKALRRMRDRYTSPALRERAEQWLRKPVPPRKE